MSKFTSSFVAACLTLLLINCGGDVSGIAPPSDNVAPVANAGAAQNVVTNTVVALNGSASSDANGDPLTYVWTLTSRPAGSVATLTGANSVMPVFTADMSGIYVASLIVNDGKASSAATTVTIISTTGNIAPVANAGAAQYVVTSTLVTLNGSASTDANGDSLTYIWTLTSRPAGSVATLTGANSVAPTFTADMAGTYVASLVVNDGIVNSTAATVTITVTDGSVTPRTSIRLDTARFGSDTATFSGSPNPAIGVLATGWIKSTHTTGNYPLGIVNQDFWTIRGSNWMLQAVPAATTSSASVAGYTNNVMFFGSAGTSTDIWASDYLLHYDYTTNEATALGWVFCAWHIIVNGSANIVVTQKYRYYSSNTFFTDTATITIATLRSQLNSRSGTSNFSTWVPSNAAMSFSLGNGLSVPFDLTRVRIYQAAAMPSDAALLTISNSDTADAAAWADYAFNWVSGAPVLTDRSGNGRNLSTHGTLYQGAAF